ncbi:InlB B-repeat-containing protein [Clostridium sp. E02]|uniref:InlB B-repeat-containing protein n=1 Tax=Clostridium sp. E02 TaxID=2487134 RepID=UPI0013DE21E4|nr:InlB B-repeat-containing protein [Clostridium sp. E02]
MKKRLGRIVSLCLTVALMTTNIGYLPPVNAQPFTGISRKIIEDTDSRATPSTATRLEATKTTPSEATKATPSEATPSNADKNFTLVKIDPEDEDIPEYYSQVTKAGKKFWKFEDRYGAVQYRDYGFIKGEAEFPVWYETDQTGTVTILSDFINPDDEYYDLAPYIYESVKPETSDWEDLSNKIFGDTDTITKFKKDFHTFMNWDESNYSIWSVIQKTDLGYFYYGQIQNERDSFNGWYYADLSGNIRPILQMKTMMLAAENTVKLTLDANGGTIYKQNVYEKDVEPGEYLNKYLNFDELEQNLKRTGYDFWGWFENPEGTGLRYRYNSKITEDKTLYARWHKVGNNVTFYRNYPQGDKSPYSYNTKNIYYGDQIGEFPDLYPVGKGLELKGWYLNEYCTGNPVTPDQIMGETPLSLYAKWGDFDVTYKLHYGYGIDETNLPSEIKAKSTADSATLAKYYLPKLNSNDLFVPGRYDGYWSDEPDSMLGAVIFEKAIKGSWFPTKHVTDLYLRKKIKNIAIDLSYPVYEDGSDWITSGVGGAPYQKYGEVLSDRILQILMNKVPSGKKVYGFYYDEKRTQPIDLSLPLYPHDPHDETTGFVRLMFYMKCAKETSIITFKDFDGSIIMQEPVNFGEDISFPDDPVRNKYTFIGWDKDLGNLSNLLTDTVVTAQYEKNNFKLKLDANSGNFNGNNEKTYSVDKGETLKKYLDESEHELKKNNFKFLGWYSDKKNGLKIEDSLRMPSNDLTLYAHWERSSSEVTFKDWNGTVLERQEVSIGADATLPEIPERPGYTFTGWDKPLTNIQDHTDITAQYSINGYLLTLDGNGGTLEGNSTKEVVVSFDQSFDQVLKDGRDLINRPGYHFDGWYTSALGGTGYAYSGNQMPSIDVNVFAHWSPNTYKITFDPNHKKWVGGEFKEEHTFDTELGTLPAPEIYGWKFNGWWTGKNGSGTKITEHSLVDPKDMIYYGNWLSVAYPVRFLSKVEQPEGESVQTFPVNQVYDEVFHTLPEPEEKGYTFIGWYDGDNKKINPQSIFQPDSGAEGYTYHAGWKANHYKIRFVSNDTDGTPVVTEMNQEYPSQFGTLPTPEKSGYTFVGWFKENGDEATAGSWIEAGDREYKARWIANQYTIHFNRNLPESETVENPQDKTVTYALPVGVLPHLNETGYLFLGWFTELDGGNQVKETTLAALGDQTYYGHWVIGIIDNGNGTYRRPGADGKWNTVDDELWWKGLDGISRNSDDKQILTFSNGTGSYADNGNGTHYRTDSENWISGIEHWWNGTDGIPGTDDDIRIYNGGHGSSGTPIYYIDSGNGMYIRPGASGNWASGTEYWWYGADGKPGTTDDRQIYGLPGGSGYYIDNGDGTYIRPGTGGSWENGTEYWWYGADGKLGTAEDRQIHIIPGGSGYYIDNGNGTYTRSGTGGSWENGTEYWWYGTDGKPGTTEDRQIHIIPGGTGYYIDNGDGTYTRSGTGGSWENGTEHWWYGADGKPGTADDKQIHIIPGGTGYYIDNGDGTYTRPGTDGSWGTNEDETWNNGPDGKPGTADDYKQIDTEPTNPEPTKPEPTKPEPTKPEPTKPEPTDPEPEPPKPTEKSEKSSEREIVTSPIETIIDSKEKLTAPDTGGTFQVDPDNPYDVTYKKSDGSIASNEWVGDGEDWYHVGSRGKLNYDWYLDGQKTWYKLNKETGDKFGAALIGWNHETMDDKKYFFDPKTTQMLTGWQCIDHKWYYFTKQNEAQTYYGTNDTGWAYEPKMPGKPYGSMYQNEKTPDGYRVDENGVWIRK